MRRVNSKKLGLLLIPIVSALALASWSQLAVAGGEMFTVKCDLPASDSNPRIRFGGQSSNQHRLTGHWDFSGILMVGDDLVTPVDPNAATPPRTPAPQSFKVTGQHIPTNTTILGLATAAKDSPAAAIDLYLPNATGQMGIDGDVTFTSGQATEVKTEAATYPKLAMNCVWSASGKPRTFFADLGSGFGDALGEAIFGQ